ncbi:Sodium-driven chloride bicarbonate exchanger [Hypsibius exemplaris]|uniref:Anion exchange protein n=1 Tax=Hypsibius exemplaris TaxID=2072580 RepID=A0A1W0X1A1_HYPEX|nr:Sodium-driven chloride bicarbonate exchanger [Hypsibius exemplaris]
MAQSPSRTIPDPATLPDPDPQSVESVEMSAMDAAAAHVSSSGVVGHHHGVAAGPPTRPNSLRGGGTTPQSHSSQLPSEPDHAASTGSSHSRLSSQRSANNYRRQRSAGKIADTAAAGRTQENAAVTTTGRSSSISSFGIQFTLGDGDDTPDEHLPPTALPHHPLFCEMEELRRTKDGSLEWRETARWVKYEEDVEEAGRWSKPFVAALQLTSLLELRTYLAHAAIILDAQVPALPPLCDLIIDEWINKSVMQEYLRAEVRDLLLRRHRHQFEGQTDPKTPYALRQLSGIGRSISHGIFNMTHTETGDLDGIGGPTRRKSQSRVSKVTSVTSMGSSQGSEATLTRNSSRGNLNFARKLPPDAESATILVGEVEFLARPVCAFVRVQNDICLGNLTEVNIPTRFIFLLLGPPGSAGRFREIGRAMGALCSDDIFQQQLYRAKNRSCIPDAVESFLHEVTVLPPGEWDPQIRIEPPKVLPVKDHRKLSPLDLVPLSLDDEKENIEVRRTDRLFGGLVGDIRCKAKYYVGDFRDGLALQCLASMIFLYFATLTPIIAFGAVLGVHTDNHMAAMESIVSAAFVGVIWALFSGQPLIIMGSTGPVLVFEAIVTMTCRTYDLDYLPIRFWIGLWTGFFLFIMVATDASHLVRYITRFTEEGFAALISFIFIFESLEKLLAVRKERNVCTYPMECPVLYSQCSCNITGELLELNQNISKSWCKVNGGRLVGDGCFYIPDVFFMSVLLFGGTFILSAKLKNFRNQPFFPTKFRQIVSDFSVTAAIILMSLLDFYLGLDTPKLSVPTGLTPTRHDRSWFVHPFERNPWWTALAAIVPALFAVILIFMDQQITAVIINRSENKLRKGCGYHLDLLVLTVSVIFCAVCGLPWMVAATVLSINHVNSLKQESESRAPGEAAQFVKVRENRLTTLGIYVLIGASVFMKSILSRIPMPVLYGVFLFMGVSALRGLQFVDRLAIIFMPMKHQPDFIYLRHIPLRRVHLFTFIQVVCLALLWVLKSFDESSILFPLMVLALVGVRKLMDFIFAQKELALLDDLMPEQTRRKKEDETLSLAEHAKSDETPQDQQTGSGGTTPVISVHLPNGHIMKIPKIATGSVSKKGPASPTSLERVDENHHEPPKSPRPGRWLKSRTTKNEHSTQPLLPKVSANPRHGQIPEEGSPSPLPVRHSPIITICPATPTQTLRGMQPPLV